VSDGFHAAFAADGLVEIEWRARRVCVEYGWVSAERRGAPLVVFLHGGVGSRAMWRGFPQELCDAAGYRGLVISRPGSGRSTPRASDEVWGPDFMHRQAHEVLPAVLSGVGIDEPVWLFGHSDGGSIALLYAARFGERVAGAIVLAPHIVVEDICIAAIERERVAYGEGDLRRRLAKYHDDPDSMFLGWSDAWLNPQFRSWSIESEIVAVKCPVLAMQGREDDFGTMEQIRGIARIVPQTEWIELADCGHSPQRDQPQAVIAASVDFLRRCGATAASSHAVTCLD
jgi:pimeloyl-ACP methyl ester carboxylesterase